MSSLWDEVQEKLLLWQLAGESELFRHLNFLRMIEKDRNLEEVGKEEAKYFNFYRNCFILETAAVISLVPVGIFGFAFYKAFNQPKMDPKLIQNRLVRLLLCGIPSLNLFIFNSYRRYIHVLGCEKALERKYSAELRQLRIQEKEDKKSKKNLKTS